jgi:hypothetical protein
MLWHAMRETLCFASRLELESVSARLYLRSGDERVLLFGPLDEGGPFFKQAAGRCGSTIELEQHIECQPFSPLKRLRAQDLEILQTCSNELGE